jgi:hypothetical protein
VLCASLGDRGNPVKLGENTIQQGLVATNEQEGAGYVFNGYQGIASHHNLMRIGGHNL